MILLAKQLKWLVRALQLFFRVQSFASFAASYDYAQDVESSNGAIPADLLDTKRSEALKKARSYRRGILGAFFWVLASQGLAVAVGLAGSRFLKVPSDAIVASRVFAVFLVAWGVLGRGGWALQSWGGQTAVEQVERQWFRFLRYSGAFVATLTIVWR